MCLSVSLKTQKKRKASFIRNASTGSTKCLYCIKLSSCKCAIYIKHIYSKFTRLELSDAWRNKLSFSTKEIIIKFGPLLSNLCFVRTIILSYRFITESAWCINIVETRKQKKNRRDKQQPLSSNHNCSVNRYVSLNHWKDPLLKT